MARKKQKSCSPRTPRPELAIHNDFFRKLVKEGEFEPAEQEQELAECLNVAVNKLPELVETDNFVTSDALFCLGLFPDADYAVHNNYVCHFVRSEMVDWEKEEFAETLGVTVEQLDTYIERPHFLTEGAMDYMRGCSGMGLEVPVIPGHEVILRRERHDDTIDYIVVVIRCSDGAVVGAAGEMSFDASVCEVMMLGGPPGCEDLDIEWETRRFGLVDSIGVDTPYSSLMARAIAETEQVA